MKTLILTITLFLVLAGTAVAGTKTPAQVSKDIAACFKAHGYKVVHPKVFHGYSGEALWPGFYKWITWSVNPITENGKIIKTFVVWAHTVPDKTFKADPCVKKYSG